MKEFRVDFPAYPLYYEVEPCWSILLSSPFPVFFCSEFRLNSQRALYDLQSQQIQMPGRTSYMCLVPKLFNSYRYYENELACSHPLVGEGEGAEPFIAVPSFATYAVAGSAHGT